MTKDKTSQATLMDNIRQAASRLKNGKLKRLNLVAPALNGVCSDLGFESDLEAMVFVAIFDRQTGCNNSDLEDISNYFEISSLDTMQFVPAINNLVSKGYLFLENRGETLLTEKKFLVSPDVFYAIIEGRKAEPVIVVEEIEYDQFDFCKGVDKLKEERRNNSIETRKLFICVEKMEQEHPELELVSQTRSLVEDIESRTFFYEMCNDFAENPDGSAETDINSTLEDIYERVLQRAKFKLTLLDSTNPLVTADLVVVSGDNEVKLTAKGIRLLLGDKADAYLKSNKVENRYEFVDKVCHILDCISIYPSDAQKRMIYSDLRQLESDNESLSLVKKLNYLISEPRSRLLFYLIAYWLVDGRKFSLSRLSEFCSRGEEVNFRHLLKEKETAIVSKGLIEITGGGMYDTADIELTDKGRELFLEEDLYIFESRVDSKDLILPENIVQKQLFFESTLQHQLDLLTDCLSEENYPGLCERLVQNKLPKGVAVLLYGNPGTGKTESVMQLARVTGRTVFHVDISSTKTCWFGESEKLIKEVFTKYKKLCEKSKIKPILLFNEADAVFSKRKDSNFSDVAQTENAIQNIILEEIENLDGILIATTNLASNLDKAFERRFLFKIHFDRPTLESRVSIWMDKLKTLTPEEAKMLASKYDFTGGEIDNIVRKVIMTEVIEGKRPAIERIIEFCDHEKLLNKSLRIGF